MATEMETTEDNRKSELFQTQGLGGLSATVAEISIRQLDR